MGCSGAACMPGRVASRMRALHPAPGEPDRRLALSSARRSALGAEGAACVCSRQRSRWLPSTPRATVRAARPCPCASLVAASRYALGAEGVGAARQGSYMFPVDNLRALPLGSGDVEDVVRFALVDRDRPCRIHPAGEVCPACPVPRTHFGHHLPYTTPPLPYYHPRAPTPTSPVSDCTVPCHVVVHPEYAYSSALLWADLP